MLRIRFFFLIREALGGAGFACVVCVECAASFGAAAFVCVDAAFVFAAGACTASLPAADMSKEDAADALEEEDGAVVLGAGGGAGVGVVLLELFFPPTRRPSRLPMKDIRPFDDFSAMVDS